MAGEASFTLTPADLAHLQRTMMRLRMKQRRFFLRLCLLYIAGFALACIMVLGSGGTLWDGVTAGLIGLVAGTLFLAIIIVGGYLLIPRRAARTFMQQRTLHDAITMRWQLDGFELQTPYGTTRYPWSQMYEWTEGRHAILVLASDIMAYCIPVRAVDAQLLADLRETLRGSGIPQR